MCGLSTPASQLSNALPSAPPGLRCQLYRFQRRALSWMLWRESFSGAGAAAGADPDPDSAKARLQEASLAWQRVPLPSGADVYWDALEGASLLLAAGAGTSF